MAHTFSRDSQSGVPKLSRFGLPGLWVFITSRFDLWLGWGLKQSCSSPQELSNGVLHSTCTHRDWVDSWLLVVRSQIANLIPGPSFDHNLCCRCPNGSCEAILDIYTSTPFQRYKEHLDARCLDPWNCILSFWESGRTPKSHFQECEWWLHTSLKVGLRHCALNAKIQHFVLSFNISYWGFIKFPYFTNTTKTRVWGWKEAQRQDENRVTLHISLISVSLNEQTCPLHMRFVLKLIIK
jgi:hypothetical protein